MDPLPASNEVVKVVLSWALEKGITIISFSAVETIGERNKSDHIPPKARAFFMEPDFQFCSPTIWPPFGLSDGLLIDLHSYTSGTTGDPKGLQGAVSYASRRPFDTPVTYMWSYHLHQAYHH